MMLRMKVCRCLFLCLSYFILVEGAEPDHLQAKDITQVMQQIFDQHVDKKEMTLSILKNSFKVYIDQFDPDRIYLFEDEVRPFLQITDAQLQRTMQQYKQSQFPEYMQLNQAIQKAILRQRELRAKLFKDQQEQLFQKSASVKVDGYEDWSDPDLKLSFAKNQEELTDRLKHVIWHFIAANRKRYGDNFILGHEAQILHLYDKIAREQENLYLFKTANDQPMSDQEKENTFSMHVLKAISNSLDAHTTILNSSEAYDMRLRLEKEVDGIGIVVQPTKDGGFAVDQILEGSPAAKNGSIKISDRLLEVDGNPVAGKGVNEVMEMIRGKLGTTASLVFKRVVDDNFEPISKTFQVDLVRQEIIVNEDRVQSSFVPFDNGIIGKITLDSFYQGDNGISSENDMREALKKLDRQGNLRGLILDFRENSGGFLAQAIKVAGLFITNGIVVISKYFNGEEHFYRDMDGKLAYEGPLIILTSKATASAAEIVAQALQDYGVALVVGDEHTYGKGTIQSQTVTENQASAYFKVTVGKYYTVSGRTPQIEGVLADVVVPSQFYHENIGEQYLDNPLPEDKIASSYSDNLQDISPNLRSWYMRYYLPTVQHRKQLSKNILPTLQANSRKRIASNANYQKFLKGVSSVEATKAWKQEEKKGDDLQMAEAVNIMKDLITLEAQQRAEANGKKPVKVLSPAMP